MKNIKNLVFDLDDTLYPQSLGYKSYFVEKRNKFIEENIRIPNKEFSRLIEEYSNDGRGVYDLFQEHGQNFDEYIKHCEDDMSKIEYNHLLKEQLESLSHNMYIFTDSHHKHTVDTLKRLKLDDFFKNIYTIKEGKYIWKAFNKSIENFLNHYSLNPKETAIFEDSLHNLEKAKETGMVTILIDEKEKEKEKPEYCDYSFPNINEALKIFIK